MSEACAVCGQGGYWVAWSEPYKGWRCVNHIQTPRTSGLCLACGMVCTDPTHDADYHKLADVDPENRRER